MENINLDNYADGFNQGGTQDVMLLKKALDAGYQAGTGNSSDVLKVQSLEKTLKNVQYKEKDMAFWMQVPKLPAYSTVEEYNQLTDYGADTGGFFTEGDAPEGVDSSYARKVELVKYIGVTKSVTHAAQLVTTNVGDLMMHASMTGTRWVLRKADRALATANANIVPEEFNGIQTLHRNSYASYSIWDNSTHVRDIRGKRLVEDDLEDGSELITSNHGSADLFIAAPPVLSGFVKQYRESKFIQPNTAAVSNAIMGQRVKTFESQFSTIGLEYDKFLRQTPRQTGDNATHAKAPAVPVPDVTTPVAVATDATAKFYVDFEGDYFIAIAAVNKYGESTLAALSNSLVTVANDEALDIKFAAGAGTYAATGFIVYRSEVNPTTALADTPLYPVLTVSVAERTAGFDGGAAGIVREKNRTIPNTYIGFLIENDIEVWSFKQLAPLMKMDLSRNGTADRFMVLLYGTPQLYMPKKLVMYKNIGNRAS